MDVSGKGALFGPPHSWAAVNGIAVTELRSPGPLVLCVLRWTEGGNRTGRLSFSLIDFVPGLLRATDQIRTVTPEGRREGVLEYPFLRARVAWEPERYMYNLSLTVCMSRKGRVKT